MSNGMTATTSCFFEDLLKVSEISPEQVAECEPTKEVAEDEVVIGVLPENLRYLQALSAALLEQHNDTLDLLRSQWHNLSVKEASEMDPQEKENYWRPVKLLDARIRLLKEILDLSLIELFPETLKYRGQEVRKGWKLVPIQKNDEGLLVRPC